MLEVEMKFWAPDLETIERQLKVWAAERAPDRTDIDRYFNAPDRDFAHTDEALRVRSIGTRNLVTYKGPKLDKETKTRTEIEVPLADGPEVAHQFQQMLRQLRYRFVAEVRKERTIYRCTRGGYRLEVCLDEVAELGQFVEVEIVAPEDQLQPAQAVLRQAANELGLTAGERRSYLELLLERRGKEGIS
jgi:adenylate cyclase class 2